MIINTGFNVSFTGYSLALLNLPLTLNVCFILLYTVCLCSFIQYLGFGVVEKVVLKLDCVTLEKLINIIFLLQMKICFHEQKNHTFAEFNTLRFCCYSLAVVACGG